MINIKMLRKLSMAFVVLAVILAAIPLTTVGATGLADEGTPPDNTRLETIWAKQLAAYQRAETMLDRSNGMIAKVQSWIGKANEKGYDTSAIQAALDAYQAAIRDARPDLNSANGIVTSHKGFDDSGKVTDATEAIESIKGLGQHLKDVRAAMNGSGQALREAIQAFREAHRPTTTP